MSPFWHWPEQKDGNLCTAEATIQALATLLSKDLRLDADGKARSSADTAAAYRSQLGR